MGQNDNFPKKAVICNKFTFSPPKVIKLIIIISATNTQMTITSPIVELWTHLVYEKASKAFKLFHFLKKFYTLYVSHQD